MQNIIKVIEELKTLSGNKQLDYLKSQSDNELLKEVLLYTYDPSKMYKIQEKSFNKCFDKFNNTVLRNRVRTYEDLNLMSWQIFKNYLDKFSNSKGVSELDIERFIAEFWDLYDHEQLELYKAVLFKDLRLGLGLSSFNRVWSDFCVDYPYFGATGLNDKTMKKIKYPSLAQIKEDGLFCNGFANKDRVSKISRQGEVLEIGTYFDSKLQELASFYNKDMVFTGEIRVLRNKETIDYLISKTKKEKVINELTKLYDSKSMYLPRTKSNGLINDEKRPESLNKYIYYIIWDAIPESCFWQKEYFKPYGCRYDELKLNIEKLDFANIYPAVTIIINSYDDIVKAFNTVIESGEEGLVIKNTDSIWKDTKTMQFKIKAKEDCDLKIVGFEEGNGRLSGMCGRVLCESKDGLLKVAVKPRTDDLCEDVWNNQDKYIDKILCVQYNEKIKNKDCDGYTLQYPVWVEIRTDKNIADNIKDIK